MWWEKWGEKGRLFNWSCSPQGWQTGCLQVLNGKERSLVARSGRRSEMNRCDMIGDPQRGWLDGWDGRSGLSREEESDAMKPLTSHRLLWEPVWPPWDGRWCRQADTSPGEECGVWYSANSWCITINHPAIKPVEILECPKQRNRKGVAVSWWTVMCSVLDSPRVGGMVSIVVCDCYLSKIHGWGHSVAGMAVAKWTWQEREEGEWKLEIGNAALHLALYSTGMKRCL